MNIYVGVYVYVSVYLAVRLCSCMYVCMYVYLYIYVYVCIFVSAQTSNMSFEVFGILLFMMILCIMSNNSLVPLWSFSCFLVLFSSLLYVVPSLLRCWIHSTHTVDTVHTYIRSCPHILLLFSFSPFETDGLLP